jgi:long-chain acyl-CoA synthetase
MRERGAKLAAFAKLGTRVCWAVDGKLAAYPTLGERTMSLNLGSLLRNSTKQFPDATALIHGNTRLTYAELECRVRRLATELRACGIEPGDRVALMAPTGPYFTIGYFGILYAGATVVALSTLQSPHEVAFQLNDCQAKALILHADCQTSGRAGLERAEHCRHLLTIQGDRFSDPPIGARSLEMAIERPAAEEELHATRPDDTAVILYTSGTTGIPKGAELTHFNLFYNAQYSAERAFSLWPTEMHITGPGNVGLASLPLYHIFGQTSVQNAMLFGGAAITYLQRFSAAEAVAIIQRDRVTMFAGVPTMYFSLLHDTHGMAIDLSSLKYCVSGGAPLPIDVKNAFFDRYGIRILEGYGLTETSPLAIIQRPNETAKAGSIGKPITGVDFRIVDEHDREVPSGERGEIVLRGHNIMKGYFRRPEETAHAMRGGWFHTGDVGYVDADGDVVIVDRQKDMIIRGGYNVYPREIEEILYSHPAVREAAVVGVPHERYGEEVKAVVSLKPNTTATPQEIIDYCRERVATYKYPRVVEILPDLPKGATGKILKRALRGGSVNEPYL